MFNLDDDEGEAMETAVDLVEVAAPVKAKRKSPAKKPAKAKAKKAKAPAKAKAAKKTKANGKAKTNGGGIVSQFGIREGGERAAIVELLTSPVGRKRTAKELAKLTDSKSTARVAGIMTRIEQKSAKYRLGYKVLREKNEDGRVYALQRK